jgi:hypothetical protein
MVKIFYLHSSGNMHHTHGHIPCNDKVYHWPVVRSYIVLAFDSERPCRELAATLSSRLGGEASGGESKQSE